MKCQKCGRKLKAHERKQGVCEDRTRCAERAADKAMRGMVMKPGMAVPDEQLAAVYHFAPKLGDK